MSAYGGGPAYSGSVLVLNATGKRCPLPVIELARHIADVPVGGLLCVLADDEAAALDIPAWCEMRGQEYVERQPLSDGRNGWAYVVRRRS